LRKIISILFFILIAASSHAEEGGADFSFFHDPNEAMPLNKTTTQAEPPCITCNANPVVPKNIQDNKKVIKKVQSKTLERITRDRPKTEKTDKSSLAGAAIWNQYPSIAGYSNSSAVAKMIRFAEDNSKKRVSGGKCYRFVKEALCNADRPACRSKLVRGYLNGTPVFPELPSTSEPKIGNNAIRNLKKEGFVDLLEKPEFSEMIKNPASAPKGAILIYKGGTKGGHIEIKTGYGTSGTYISDFRAPDSVMGNELAGRASRNYKLVSVMIKPAEKIK